MSTRQPATTTFAGFPDAALAFYEGLEADNTRAYWGDHQQVYLGSVRGPMEALLAQLEPRFGTAKLFRPYRDVRFSKDKSPYKAHIGAVLAEREGGPAYYVQISATGLLLGGGYYQFGPEQLSRYRQAVLRERTGEQLAAIVDALTAPPPTGQPPVTLAGPTLLRAPRGVDPTHPRVALLRHKGLAATVDLGVTPWLGDHRAAEHIAGWWARFDPLLAWLAEHVGAEVTRSAPAAAGRSGRSR